MKNTKNSFFIHFIVFAILILIVGFSLKNIYELNNNTKWVVQTHEVKMALANNLSSLIDMETGQRGFALAGNRDFLEYENSAKPQIQKNILHLQTLLKDNPSQLLRLDSLKQVIDLKIEFNSKVIKAREQFGLNAAVAIISTRRGKQIMDSARTISGNMLEAEEKLLNDRNKTVAHSYFLAQIFVIVGGILSILIVIFLMIINYKSLKLKSRLLKSEGKFKQVLESAPDGIVVIGHDRKIRIVNAQTKNLFGYTKDEMIGKEVQMLMPDLFPEGHPAHERKFIADQKPRVMGVGKELFGKRKDGSEFAIEISLVPLQLGDEKEEKIVLATIRDITEQKKTERKITSNQAYTRSLIEASLDPLVTISAEGKITDVNEASVKVTGETREKLIGTDFSDYFTEPEKAREGYKQVFDKGFVSDYPLTIHRKNGTLTDVLYNATVYKDDKGNVLGIFAAARDVTAQKQASLYARSLIEASLDPLVTISPEGKITDVNEASVKVTGVPRLKLIGTDFSDYFTEPQKAREGYKQVFKKGFVSDYPLTIHHKNGKLTDVLYNATVYKDDKGNVLGVFAAARDVTEQKQASQYSRSLIEASLDPLVTISAEGKITDVNEASVKITGETREKLIGTDFSDYFTEPEKAREGYKQVFKKGFVSDYPLTIHHKNGKLTDVLYNATVYKDDKENVLGVFAAARDVTAQKAIELSLANKELILQNKEKEKQAAVLEIANIELKFQNDEKEKRAAELNIANEELAFQNDEKEKRAAELIIANEELAFQNDEKEKRAAELIIANKELAFQNDEKEKRAAELIIANKELAFQNDEKEKRAAELFIANKELAFQNDEKEKRAAELIIANKELAFQNDEKEKRAAKLVIANKELLFQNDEKEKRAAELINANKELESFNYISSHDLQEPLRKIQIFSNRLISDEAQKLSDKGKEYVLRIEESAKRMRTLIDDLLAYSRTTSSERKFKTTSLTPIIEAVKNDFKEIIIAKQATIESSEMCDAYIIPFQFHQLMHNLIGNALKFANPDKPPHIIINSRNIKGSKVKNQNLLSEKEYCHITITDNGIGFAPEYKDHIFEIFKRLHDKEKISGTGIGLTIAKKIVENHNGVIIATGELNKGASFDIYIPST